MKKCTTVVKQLAIVFSLTFAASPVFAQINSNQSQETAIKSWPKFSSFSTLNNFHADFSFKNISADVFKSQMKEWLGASTDHSLVLVSEIVDELGIKHSKYQHFFKGIKVADELVLVHEKDGKILAVNGEFTNSINATITSSISQQDVEDIVNHNLKLTNPTFAELEQVFTKNDNGRGLEIVLATKINVLSLPEVKSYDVYVDNSTKTIFKKIQRIANHSDMTKVALLNAKVSTISPFVDTSSTSSTYYRGNQSITVDSYNGNYRLKDNFRNIHTLNGTNWDGSGNPATGELTGNMTEYINATPNFTSNETKAPVEVHWSMKTAYDYYKNTHNRNSYDGNGSIIRNYYNINFNTNPNTGVTQAPINGMNAAAIDTQGIVAMVYGNGIYQGMSGYFNPVVGVDVAGHEYSHLMASRTANLAYQGESGALNEAFADMLGTAIEFYSNVNPNWTIGEGIPNPAVGFTFFRSLSNPNSGPAALGSQQPDTYNGTYWADTSPSAPDNGGVHTNSGVGNYWFYLLSQGGSGTNDIGNSFAVTGITIQKAEKIAYRTLVHYLTPNSNYLAAYNASKQAVADLYGASGNEQLQNVKAWYAVGIGDGLLAVNETVINSTNVNIYPNPATSGQFAIETNLKESQYDILDSSGKLIITNQKLSQGKNTISHPQLKAGVYLINVKSDNNTVSKKLIIK